MVLDHLSRVDSIQARSRCLALQHKVSENLGVQNPEREVPCATRGAQHSKPEET